MDDWKATKLNQRFIDSGKATSVGRTTNAPRIAGRGRQRSCLGHVWQTLGALGFSVLLLVGSVLLYNSLVAFDNCLDRHAALAWLFYVVCPVAAAISTVVAVVYWLLGRDALLWILTAGLLLLPGAGRLMEPGIYIKRGPAETQPVTQARQMSGKHSPPKAIH